jgi:hypothetical protein
MTWQYNGRAPWDEIWRWCYTNINDEFYTNNFETIHFSTERAYNFFLLRWA